MQHLSKYNTYYYFNKDSDIWLYRSYRRKLFGKKNYTIDIYAKYYFILYHAVNL